MSAHFCRAGCLPHQQIAFYALDGILQIASEAVLDQEKWTHFQQETLYPFFVIFHNQPLQITRHRVVECLAIFLSDDRQVQDGWNVLLDFFENAARAEDKWIVTQTYQLLDQNFPTIPAKFNDKLVCVLLVYATQTIEPAIQEPSMAYGVSVAMKINPVPRSLLTMVSNVLNASDNSTVILFASKLIFMLIAKFTLRWESIENEIVLPLFASSRVFLQVPLINDLFHTLFPAMGEKVLSLLPKLPGMIAALNDVTVMELFVTEVCAVFERKNPNCQRVAVAILVQVMLGPAATPTILGLAIQRVRVYSVVSVAVERAVDLKSVDLIVKGIPLVIETGLEREKKRTSEIVIEVLTFANSGVKQGLQMVEQIEKLLDEYGINFLREKGSEFQLCLFSFFLNDSLPIRKVVRAIATKTQALFRVIDS
jgi:hypothetical protein